MKTIMITGCASFIGSHTVENFLSAGYRVVGVDSMTYAASRDNMKSFIDDITFVEEDICNTQKMKELVEDNKVSWIINFAAETHVDNSIENCSNFIHSNVNGVQSLLEVCKSTGCSILQISTDEVYGSVEEDTSLEEDRLDPRNPYSATKAAAEHLIAAYHNTHKISYKMVRMSNNFGPRQHSEKFLPTILRSLMSGKKIPIYGNGSNIRDWLYVKDCANLIRGILENGKLNNVYNLTYNNEMTNIEIVKCVLGILDKDLDSSIEFVEDRPGHDFRYAINNSKMLEVCDKDITGMADAIEETILHYKNRRIV